MTSVRVTHLNQWDYYLRSEMTADELMERLTGRAPSSPAAERGTRFHADMERILAGETPSDEFDLWSLDRDIDLLLPRDVQSEASLSMTVAPGVTLTGHVDAWSPSWGRVWDFKTTGKAIDLEKYYHQEWQWRAYMLMTGATSFQYQVFQLRDVKGGSKVVDHASVTLHPYSGMVGDVRSATMAVAEFIEANRA